MKPKVPSVSPPVLGCTDVEAARLVKAGFRPVVRWVDVEARSDTPLKTIEALTLLDRREAKRKSR
jgi:hypothetical protein